MWWQTVASIACFTFVYYWHGSEYYIFLWSIFNFVGIALEVIASLVLDNPSFQKFEVRKLNIAYKPLHAQRALSVAKK